MSLLHEIQDLATSEGDIANLLRKCKILAARLGSMEFSQWIDWELDGYPKDNLLPEYRMLAASTWASFMNTAYTAERQPVLWEALPPQAREALKEVKFPDGIAKAQSLKKGCKIPRPDVAIRLQGKMYPDMNCVSAWQEISSLEIEQILSAVRNKILDFVLKIEAENPEAGEARIGSEPVPQEKLRPIVNNFFATVGNVAQHSSDFSQAANFGLDPKDLGKFVEEFSNHLSDLNLSESQKAKAEAQIAVLQAELKSDADDSVIRQAGRTLRNITEGAMSSLLASGMQPHIWHWIHQMLQIM